jgi:hypothetical protein
MSWSVGQGLIENDEPKADKLLVSQSLKPLQSYTYIYLTMNLWKFLNLWVKTHQNLIFKMTECQLPNDPASCI